MQAIEERIAIAADCLEEWVQETGGGAVRGYKVKNIKLECIARVLLNMPKNRARELLDGVQGDLMRKMITAAVIVENKSPEAKGCDRDAVMEWLYNEAVGVRPDQK